jgi:phosphopantothenoylcysteine decarboxylase/phosphopantothenate--cysteine ligase
MRVLTPRPPWQSRRIVLGVSGGIAAYKSVQLARDLTRLGAHVDVVMTEAATRFVGPLSFEGVTGRRPLTDMWSAEGVALHIRLGRDADLVLVAPATADLMARAAEGRADDLLTTTLLATQAPVLMCPAMNHRMYAHPQTQANLERLQSRLGYHIAGPAIGPLAAGEESGPGRMLEPGEITEHAGRLLSAPHSRLEGLRVLITSGPTREPLDPVRYVGNRSSGKTGHALCAAAWRRGAHVTLVTGPVSTDPPLGAEVVEVETAVEMMEAVEGHVGDADVVVFAAAVADYRPADPAEEKLKRSAAGPELTLTLTANPDVAGDTRQARKPGAVVVGFALETQDLVENARTKLEGKGFDLIVANPADETEAGFESDTNRVTLLSSGGDPEPMPVQTKEALAEVILDRVESLLAARS